MVLRTVEERDLEQALHHMEEMGCAEIRDLRTMNNGCFVFEPHFAEISHHTEGAIEVGHFPEEPCHSQNETCG
jgi:hypothetical protein